MNTKSKIIAALIIATVLLLLFVGLAAAAAFQLAGRVTDYTGNPLAGSMVEVIDPGTGTVVASTTTDTAGDYALAISQGQYNIVITPPAESGFGLVIVFNRVIDRDTILDIVIAPPGSVTFSGRLLDSLGNGVPNQNLNISSGSISVSSTTDASGAFRFEVAPGDYEIEISGGNHGDISLNVPSSYYISTKLDSAPNFHLTQSTVMDLTLPIVRVDVQTQDSVGNPVANVSVNAQSNTWTTLGFNMGSILFGHGRSQSQAITDASGNTVLWLFRNTIGRAYDFTATPPNNSPYVATNLLNVSITTDTSLPITLLSPVTFSGRLLDSLGNGVPNQNLNISSGSISVSSTTDASGAFRFEVAPGDYEIEISGGNHGDISLNVPSSYYISTKLDSAPNFHLTQSTVMDLTLPIVRVDVQTQDSVGNPVANVSVNAQSNTWTTLGFNMGSILFGHGRSQSQAITDASGNTVLWLFRNTIGRAYDFTATPPNNSPYVATNLLNVSITTDTSLPITLLSPVTFSGRLLDSLGNGVPNQNLNISSGSISVSSTTDASGAFRFEVAPGDYEIEISGGNHGDISLNVPSSYYISTKLDSAPNFHLTQSTVMDLTLPIVRVDVQTQDSVGNPVANVSVNAQSNTWTTLGFNMGSILFGHGRSQSQAITDASGNTVLWLFRNTIGRAYDFTATPPNNSPFYNFTVRDIAITSDKTLLISLEFVHEPPATIASLSPSPNAQNEYPDPVAVTFSATAYSGFAVTATYCNVDGGATQTYSSPFTVSGDGSHTIRFWSADNIGVIESPNTLTFQIQSNQPPTVNPGGSYSVNEGDSVVVAASGNDPENGNLSYAWDLDNNGSFETPGQSATFSAMGLDGPSIQTIQIQVTDDGGLTATAQTTVNVLNVAPTVGAITAPINPVQVNTAINTSVNFTDLGVLDTHTAVWDWGDSSISAGTVNETNGSGSVTGNHTYASAGVYTIKVTVTDDDGDSGESIFQYVVIYDPNGGFVTGGGWINSPAGAYTPDPNLTGKATFGFVSKHQKGASVPTGNTEFQFHVADLNFKSTSYDWLVIAGSKAQYKGTGTINGAGEYGFMLTAIDGTPDKFRIKIWDKATGEVIYDNQLGASDNANPSTVIQGGSIVIHKGK